MKYASQNLTNIEKIKQFFKIENKSTNLEDIASMISIGDSTLEYLTLCLIRDKMTYNRYFELTIHTYNDCKQNCSKLLN